MSSTERRRLIPPVRPTPPKLGTDADELARWARKHDARNSLEQCPELDALVNDSAPTRDLLRALGADPPEAEEAMDNWMANLTLSWSAMDEPARIAEALALVFLLRLRWQRDSIRATYRGRHSAQAPQPAEPTTEIWFEQYLAFLGSEERDLVTMVLAPWSPAEIAEALRTPASGLAIELYRSGTRVTDLSELFISEEGLP
ncbi:hypothetical protein [Actinoplanes sp. GCM10030250]|uniref:hypothetical protein n=1 Tax=Actinoplanes sp. GCM10030250 TaxID=3273376 RepID=UPI003623F5E5